MNKNSYLSYLLFAITIVFFASCDSDYNELGADIIGADNFNFTSKTYPMTLTGQYIGAAESRNLPVNPLGVYDNPVFGLTEANFVTQLSLQTPNPTFDPALSPEIYSVVLYVPLFSTQKTAPTATALGTYSLDSIYGPKPALSAFKLSVYESKYFIRDVNPADQLSQAYFNDNSDFVTPNIGTERLNTYGNATDQSQNDKFIFNPIEYVDMDSTKTTFAVNTVIKRAPALKLNLDKAFFTEKIINAPAGKLLNDNVFRDYFRGIYFKAEQVDGKQGNMAMLNFALGKIVINYKQYKTAAEAAMPTPPAKSVLRRLALNMTGNTISLIKQGPPHVTPNPTNVVIKGGANNSMAIVDLFGSQVQLDSLRNQQLLINDASLTFTIARATAGSQGMDELYSSGESVKAAEPLRLYLYDLNNRRAIADYSLDQSTSTKLKLGKTVYGGIIKRDKTAEKRGLTYKIKITKHIMQLIARDTTTNVRLGLVVTEDINNSSNVRIKNPIGNIIPAGTLKVIPTMSAIHPLGTILCGSNDPEPANRPRFEIHYTKPKQN